MLKEPTGHHPIRFLLNGQPAVAQGLPPSTTLLDFVRSQGLTGSKEGCAEGECGSCTVLLLQPNHGGSRLVPINSCLMLLPMAAGQEIYTVEALAREGRLAEVQDAKDRELREHVVVKEQLLAEAEKLLPVTDARSARSQLRGILERWERAGALPRDAQERLEGGMRKIEETVRKAEDSHWRRTNPEALSRARGTVEQIRSAITQLERQLAKAQTSGDQKAQQQAQEAIEARKSWLAEAERTLAELSG